MSYKAEISRVNPGCFIFLIDESESMSDPLAEQIGKPKCGELSTVLNRLLHALSIRCAKSDSIYDYFSVALVGYSNKSARYAFGGALAGKDMATISELANNPIRIEDKIKKCDDGAGGVVEEVVKFPIWYEAKTEGGTPMCAALREAHKLVERWGIEHPTSFPPVIINITDGESTDGDPLPDAQALMAMGTEDGPSIFFNVHLSGSSAPSIEMPSKSDTLPDGFSKKLFEMSSLLTPFMIERAKELGIPVEEGARGFVFNASAVQIIQFLDIGTRPVNLR